jgi:hypothetical protein
VLQLSNETFINDERHACVYDPPLEVLHNPMQVEDFSTQSTATPDCRETVDVSVVGRDSVKDATGRAWSTWVVEFSTERGATTEERHWFSPELGRDVRLETTTSGGGTVNQTAQLLKSYPKA